jgi:ADP-ribosylglycohydrolase
MTKTFQVTPAMKRIIGNVLDGKDIQTGGKTLSGVAQTCGALFRFGVLDLKNQLTEHGMELARAMRAKGDI